MSTQKRPVFALSLTMLIVAAASHLGSVPVPAFAATQQPSTTASAAPSAPPARVCGNAAILDGPTSPPPGAVQVDPGRNLYDVTQANPPGTTFWLAPGTHTLGTNPYNQVHPRDGNSYVGAPGAILDGQGVNYYAFTTKAANVTIKHLTITGFMAPGDSGVVNQDQGAGWVIERNTIHRNNGAGVMLGDDNRLVYNCLADNGQYGFQGFGARLTIDHNEVARNNTFDWEAQRPGCGCAGGAKFWAAGPATITNNWVHHNESVALWADNNNVGFLFEGNLIEDNKAQAILYETSYNFRIVNNTMRRNALFYGHQFQARNDAFPFPTIYISESGGDSRLNGGVYANSEVTGNVLEDNWGGVVVWENSDRFGHDESANTSQGFTTLIVDPTEVWPSREMWKCGDPARGGLIDQQPYYWDCRWRSMNVSIHGNDFRLSSKEAIGCTTNLCAAQAVFSNSGTVPSWSPYKGSVIQDAITFRQNNRWSNNRYSGDWNFVAFDTSRYMPFSSWTSSPYNQDQGSTYNGSTPVTTTTTTTPPGGTGPDTLWPDSRTPTENYTGTAYTLGTRFTVAEKGNVTALRFWQSQNMGFGLGTFQTTLKLWRMTSATTGVELASVDHTITVGNAGWRNVTLPTPVAVNPTERYVVSFNTPDAWGHANGEFPVTSGKLTAQANGNPSGYGNGLYIAGSTHTFPTNSDGNNSSYFADVVLVANTTGSTTTSTMPTTTTSTTSTTTTSTTTTSTTSTTTSTTSTTTTTTPVASTPQSIWPNSQTVTEADGGVPYTLGTRFVVSAPGNVTALRFHQTPKMQGPISLKLWRATGPTTAVELASVTYTAARGYYGWRTVNLATPVAVVPTERYVVTYHTPRPFALEVNHLQNARVSGNLTANANGDPVGYGNGLYKNENGHTFPTTNSNGHSYFADVVFRRG